MDLFAEPVIKSVVKRTVTKIWFLEDKESSKSNQRLVKDANDAKFIDRENILVADSAGHGVFLFKIDGDEIFKCDVNEAESRENVLDNTNNDDDFLVYNKHKFKKLLSDEVWPNCLTITPDSKIRLTDRKTKTIKTFDPRGDLLSVWKVDNDKMMKPHGIGMLNTNETVVSDTALHCIHLFSDTGQLLRSFGSRGDLLHHFRLPYFLTTDNNDHIIVSDNMNYCVKIFDREGTYMNRIGSGNLFGHRQFQSPYGVTYDSSCNEILVADYESNKVFAYDKNGEFRRYMVSGSECESPCGLSVHEDSGLLVLTTSNPDSSNVQLFKITTF